MWGGVCRGRLCDCAVGRLTGVQRVLFRSYFFFFFNDTATTEIYTLSLHDALPILSLNTCVCRLSPLLFFIESYTHFYYVVSNRIFQNFSIKIIYATLDCIYLLNTKVMHSRIIFPGQHYMILHILFSLPCSHYAVRWYFLQVYRILSPG